MICGLLIRIEIYQLLAERYRTLARPALLCEVGKSPQDSECAAHIGLKVV